MAENKERECLEFILRVLTTGGIATRDDRDYVIERINAALGKERGQR